MVVIDASAAIELVLKRPRAMTVLERLGDEDIHAPHLIDVELAHALRRLNAAKAITDTRAQEALNDFADLGVQRHAHDLFMPRIWQLRRSLTAYDAAYIALAEALDVPLLTLDAKLGRSHGHQATVEIME